MKEIFIHKVFLLGLQLKKKSSNYLKSECPSVIKVKWKTFRNYDYAELIVDNK